MTPKLAAPQAGLIYRKDLCQVDRACLFQTPLSFIKLYHERVDLLSGSRDSRDDSGGTRLVTDVVLEDYGWSETSLFAPSCRVEVY
jgi:hypothetical protein